jgi:hypothetical protein
MAPWTHTSRPVPRSLTGNASMNQPASTRTATFESRPRRSPADARG